MPQVPNKLMPILQFIAALVLIALFCLLAAGPMFGAQAADDDMKATLKDIMLILTGFLFGSAVSSGKKDDQNAALTSALIATPPAPPPLPAAPVDVNVANPAPLPVEVVPAPVVPAPAP